MLFLVSRICQDLLLYCDRSVASIDSDACIQRDEQERGDLAADPATSDMTIEHPASSAAYCLGLGLSDTLGLVELAPP